MRKLFLDNFIFTYLKHTIIVIIMLFTIIAVPQRINALSSTVVLGNDGYAYAQWMTTSSVTLVAVVSTGQVSDCKWYVSDSKDGEYTIITDATDLLYTFTPSDGKWYKCTINKSFSTKPIQLIKVEGQNYNMGYSTIATKSFELGQWYASNGTIAYTSFGEGSTLKNFDVIGLYKKEGIEYWINTSYGRGWQTFSDSELVPDISSKISAKVDTFMVSFDEENNHIINFEVDLLEGERAFAFGTDVEIGKNVVKYDDTASLKAIYHDDTVTQIQMIGAASYLKAINTDAAFTLKYIDEPSCYWLGNYTSRTPWCYNTESIDFCIASTKEIDDRLVATEVVNDDSGMTSSWMELVSGGKIKFQMGIGSVKEAGAVTPLSYTVTSTSITVTNPDSTYYYCLYDNNGTPVSPWAKKVDTNGNIVFTGLNADTQYVLNRISTANYNDELELQNSNNLFGLIVTTAINPIVSKFPNESISINSTINSITFAKLNINYSYQLLNTDDTIVKDWTSPDNNKSITFTGLEKNKQYILEAKSNTNSLSDRVIVSTKDKAITPNAVIDYDNMIITGLDASTLYYINGIEIKSDSNGNINITNDIMKSKTISIIKKGVGNNILDSDQQNISSIAFGINKTIGDSINAVIENIEGIFTKSNRVEVNNKGVTQSDIDAIENGGSVIVDLSINKNNNADDSSIIEIKKAITEAGLVEGLFVDIDIIKKVYNTDMLLVSSTNLIELPNIIKISMDLPEEYLGKSGYKVLRYHEGSVDILTATPNAYGEYIEITENKLNLYIKRFSSYALTFEANSTEVIETPNTSDYSNTGVWILLLGISITSVILTFTRKKRITII